VGPYQAPRRAFGSGVIGWTTSWSLRLIDSKVRMAQIKLALFCAGFQKEGPLPLLTISTAGSSKQKISL
jgi:hypothetical protein